MGVQSTFHVCYVCLFFVFFKESDPLKSRRHLTSTCLPQAELLKGRRKLKQTQNWVIHDRLFATNESRATIIKVITNTFTKQLLGKWKEVLELACELLANSSHTNIDQCTPSFICILTSHMTLSPYGCNDAFDNPRYI